MQTQAWLVWQADGLAALLDHLRPHCSNPRRYESLDNHTESFQWIWSTEGSGPGFVNWLRSDNCIFWISGKPGSGKSTLMKYLTENKRTKELVSKTPTPTFLISYFFYELGDPQEKAFVSLLHAFVYGLLENVYGVSKRASSTLIQILELYKIQTREQPWAQKVLQEAIRHIVSKFPITARVVLFIDGFDECDGSHADQLDFLKNLVESSKNSKLSIKICIASRAEVDIRLRLSNYPSLAIHHFTEPDISAYVAKRLKAAWELMASQPDDTTATSDQGLIDNVVRKAEGVFLWVNLVVTPLVMAIEAEAEISDLHREVNRLPEGLELLYQRIVAKIPQNRLHDAINFLQIVAITNTHDDLAPEYGADTLWKICNAMKDPSTAISEKAYFEEGFRGNDVPSKKGQCAAMRRRIQTSCRGLLHCDDASNLCEAKITFLHRTCVEYILNTEVFSQMMSKANRNLLKEPEVSLMAMALRLLKTDPQEKPDFLMNNLRQESLKRNDTRGVVLTFFARVRCAESATGSAQAPYVDELDRVCSLLWQEWASLFHMDLDDKLQLDWHTDVLCLAVLYGLTLYVSQAIQKENQTLFQRAGRPLLFYVFDHRYGDSWRPKMVQLLLEKGADPNETFRQDTPWTSALLSVADNICLDAWYCECLLLMLKYGANPCQRVLRDDSFWWKDRESLEHYTTAFHIALTGIEWLPKIEKMACIRSLLDHCENYDVVDSDGVGIAEWADTAQWFLYDSLGGTPREFDPRTGDFIRAEIAARTPRKRHHSRVEIAVTKNARKAQKKLKGVEHSNI